MIYDREALDIIKLKMKNCHYIGSLCLRSMFHAADMDEENKLLNCLADFIDQGYIQTTLGQHFSDINDENLRSVHQLLEAGSSIGHIF